MNKVERINNKIKTFGLLKRRSLSGTRVGCVKYWKNTNYEHFITICKIVYKLTNQGYECITEAEFNSGGRTDIFAVDINGNGYAIEVLCTETEKRFELKQEKYPVPIVKVDTKDFDVDTWEL